MLKKDCNLMCIQELGENRAEACARLDKKKTELVWTLNTL